jgi:sulfite reductase alpha subunit-like flavoprotein
MNTLQHSHFPAKSGDAIDEKDTCWVPAYIRRSTFKLPKDNTTPVIMVAGLWSSVITSW